MAKTEELYFNCTEIQSTAKKANVIHARVIDPEVNDILTGIHTDDLIEYVRNHIGVEEIYPQSELDKWAESEGYTKSNE